MRVVFCMFVQQFDDDNIHEIHFLTEKAKHWRLQLLNADCLVVCVCERNFVFKIYVVYVLVILLSFRNNTL